jgi:hypothetical protein
VIITNLIDWNANALKTGTGPLAGLARDFGSAASVFGGLVTAIAAVVFAVTDKGLVDALGVVALEVVGLAVDDAATWRLVGFVRAVNRAVTLPTNRDTAS